MITPEHEIIYRSTNWLVLRFLYDHFFCVSLITSPTFLVMSS